MSGRVKKTENGACYSTDGTGRWWKRVYTGQCPHEMFPSGRCQGVVGHAGAHWNYGENGWFHQDFPDDKKEFGALAGGAQQTPPEHKSYPNPRAVAKNYWMNFHEDSEVTDPEEVARLERGELRDGESLTRPFTG